MKKYGLLLKTLQIVGVLLFIKIGISLAGLSILPMNTLVTAFVGAVIFTIAIIFTGTLVDYKESEKIPGELATSIRSLYDDLGIINLQEKDILVNARQNVRFILGVICANFRENTWNLKRMHEAIGRVNTDLFLLAEKNVAPPILVKMRNELTSIDRISNRISTIAETSFIPTAYAISEVAIGAVIAVLLFLDIEPVFEGIFLFAAISMLTIGLLLLIKDMDNPFEVDMNSYADVSLDLLWNLEQEMESGP